MDLRRYAMHQLYPLEVNTVTVEPCLRLPIPRNRIIITPPRISDVDAVVATLNDPKVYHWMSGPPFPYLLEHGISWLTEQIAETDAILRHLREADASEGSALKMATGCPVRIIREVNEDGTDTYLGYVSVYPSKRQEILDEKEREAVLAEDARMEVGNPKIVWELAGKYSRVYRKLMSYSPYCVC
ncbi:hypothetical protein FPV67DRAFT_1474541, partial [Lyophyllum atratum]